MRKLLATGVLASVLYVACGDDDAGAPPVGGSGVGGEADRDDVTGTSGINALGGSGRSTGGDGAAPTVRHGEGGTGHGGESGGAPGGAWPVDEGGGCGGGSVAGSDGTPERPPLPVNGCVEFVDARAFAELRVIAWDYALGGDAGRCLLVQLGQGVTWQGPFSTHPIQPAGGTMPSPILGDTPAGATSYQATFSAPGTYGYECGLHATMRGAIRVIE